MKTIALLNFAIAITFGAAFGADSQSVVYQGKDGPGKGKHIVLMAGDEEYRSEEAMPLIGKILSQRHGFKCTVLFSVDKDGFIDANNGASLTNPEALDSADAIVMSLRFRHYPDDVKKHFTDAVNRGIPIVGLRTSTHAFNDKELTNFGRVVLGENWVSHWGSHRAEATRGVIEPSAKDNLLLRGVSDVFGPTDVYEAYPPADATILMRGQVLKGMEPTSPPADYKKKGKTGEQGVNDPMMPIAWTREVKSAAGKTNKILCTTMGASIDLKCEDLRRLIVNGVFWGLGMEVPAKADVTPVGIYNPLMYGTNDSTNTSDPYGFRGFKRGVKPSDLALPVK